MQLYNVYLPTPIVKGVFKGGGVQGVQTSPEIFRFFLKVKEKR